MGIMIGLIAQLNDVSLDFGQVVAVMVSVGTAPIPNAGMVYLTMIFDAAGLGDYTAEGLATLYVLDWFVDRIETAVNVTSDQFVAKIIDDVTMATQKKDMEICCGCCIPCCNMPGFMMSGGNGAPPKKAMVDDKSGQTSTDM